MGSLREAYKDNLLELRHIVPIDFSSFQSLPDSHAWLDQADQPLSVHKSSMMVPVIDLADPDVVKLVGQACEKSGIFLIKGHDITSELLEEVETETRRLFSLPVCEKMKVTRELGGATGYGVARIAPFFDKCMWHEGFTIMGPSLVEHAKVLWPNDHQRFSDAMERYQSKMKDLSAELLELILKSIPGLNHNLISKWVEWIYEISDTNAIQLNSYPSCPDPNRALGLAPHTDSFLLTILHQTGGDGLEVLIPSADEAHWITVSPKSEELVVNIGDLIHIISNGRIPSCWHRVRVAHKKHRYSMAYFCGMPLDMVVKPFASSSNKAEFARYKEITVREYVGLKAKSLDKALSFIRTQNSSLGA